MSLTLASWQRRKRADARSHAALTMICVLMENAWSSAASPEGEDDMGAPAGGCGSPRAEARSVITINRRAGRGIGGLWGNVLGLRFRVDFFTLSCERGVQGLVRAAARGETPCEACRMN